ncbi:MAG: hypothetical protein ABI680_10610 [Chthoniobacteraceae bacterium]
MDRPRYRLLFGGLLFGAIVLFCPLHLTVNATFWYFVLDAAHVPLFATATWLVAASNPLGIVGDRARIVCAAILTLLAAIVIEILQPLTGREESLTDLRNGTLGIALGVAFLWPASKPTAPWVWGCKWMAAAAFTLFALWPAWAQVRGLVWRRQHFPVLADFESKSEMALWRIADIGEPDFNTVSAGRVMDWPSHGEHALIVHLAPGDWPGMRWEAGEQDWRGYQSLAFDIFNPVAPFDLELRINDYFQPVSRGTCFQRSMIVERGWNHFRIPLSEIEHGSELRTLDLSAIRKLIFFRDHPTDRTHFYLDYVRLER